MSKNKGFSRVLALVLLVCMVASFAPAAYADNGEAAQEEALVNGTPVVDGTNDAAPAEQPANPGLTNTSKELFKFHCTANDEHADQVYPAYGSYVRYNNDMKYDEARGVWTASMKLTNVQTLMGSFGAQKAWGNIKHYYTDANGKNIVSADIKVIWDAEKALWVGDGDQVINVWCATAPAAPKLALLTPRSMQTSTALRVQDSNVPFSASNTRDSNSSNVNYFKALKEGTYEFSPVTKDANGDFWCTLKITDFAPYVATFNSRNGNPTPAYRIDTAKTTATFEWTLKYTGSKTSYATDGSGWTVDSSSWAKGETVRTGKLLYVDQFYVVTYTDGVDGAAFADQSYNVKPGEATPAFDGTPTRANYNFVGWEPTVAETATADVTYVAKWEVAEPAVPSGTNSTNELFKFHCTVDDNHEDQTYNWFGNYVKYNNDKQYDEARGVWTATAQITNVQTLLSAGVSCPNKVWGKTHYHTDADGNTVRTATIKLVWNPDATGLNSAKAETVGLWMPDGEQLVDVWCATAPAAPTIAMLPNATKSSTAIRVQDSKVPFVASNTRDSVSSNVHYFRNLKEGTYEFSPVTKDANGDFWCTLKITDFAPYVANFNTRNGNPTPAYEIDNDLTTATFEWTLKYTGSKTDYKIDGSGWSIQSSSWAKGETSRTGKLLYVSQFFTVTYTSGVEGTSAFADQSYVIRGGADTPAFNGTPERVGYTFAGWQPEVAEKVSGDATYTAQWTANEYVLTRDSNGGDKLDDVNVTYDAAYGDAIVASPRAGYTEDGWFLIIDKELTNTEVTAESIVNIAADHGIFLKRSIAPVTLTVSEDVTKDYDGEKVVLTASTEEYDGLAYSYQWYKDGAAIDGETGKTLTLDGNVSDTGAYTVKVTVTNTGDSGVITSNKSVVAEASVNVTVNKIDNHLTYNYNGTDDADATVDTIESSITVDADKEVSRKGYTFAGWNTAADGSGDSYKAGDELVFDDNGNGGVTVTLYAQWTANQYTLNFKIAKDKDLKEEIKLSHTSKTVTYGEPVGDFPWAYRKDYVLVWYDENGQRVSPETVYLVDGDSTYTAVWYEYIPPVQTGDSSNIALYAAAMFASIACIGAGIILLRRKKEN